MIFAIDPGRKGAVALVDSKGVLVDVADLDDLYAGPVLSPAMLRATILDLCCDRTDSVDACVVEAVNSHGMGRQSAFNFGQSLGTCRSVPLCLGIPLVDVTPATWKRDLKLGTDKDLARARAAERWPDRAAKFARKRDDGRAEAALLACWFLERGVMAA